MSVREKINRVGYWTVVPTALALSVGGVAANEVWQSNRIPTDILPPTDDLPEEKPPLQYSVICKSNDKSNDPPCTPETSLVTLYNGTQKRPTDYAAVKEQAPWVIEAYKANEDSRLDTNKGCDARGLMAAAGFTTISRGIRMVDKIIPIDIASLAPGERGGSTITRQVISNAYMPPTEQDLLNGGDVVASSLVALGRDPKTGKYRNQEEAEEFLECRHAMRLYQEVGPDGVLEKYLNIRLTGRDAQTFEESAWNFYGKPAHKLNRHQATVLAAMAPSPNNMDINFTPEEINQEKRAWHDEYVNDLAEKLLTDSMFEKAQALATEQGQPYTPPTAEQWNNARQQLSPEQITNKTREINGNGYNNAKQPFIDGIKQLVDSGVYTKERGDAVLNYRDYLQEMALLTKRVRLSFGRQLEVGYIDQQEYEELVAMPIEFVDYQKPTNVPQDDYSGADRIGARHYIDWVMPQIEKALEEQGINPANKANGYMYTVTLDERYQNALQEIAGKQEIVRTTEKDLLGVEIAQDGAVLAMRGGKDYQNSAWNPVTQGKQNSGSAYKPVAYAKAAEDGWTEDTEVEVSMPYKLTAEDGSTYTVKSEDHCAKDGTTMTPIRGLENSDNCVAAAAFDGRVQETADLANALARGIDPKDEETTTEPAIAAEDVAPMNVVGVPISTFDLTVATSNLVANQGSYVEPYALQSIHTLTEEGTQSTEIYSHQQQEPQQFIEPEYAQLAVKGMNAVMHSGTADGSSAMPNGPESVVGKTGTTDGKADLTFVRSKYDGTYNVTTRTLWLGNPHRREEMPESKLNSGTIARISGDMDRLLPQFEGEWSLIGGVHSTASESNNTEVTTSPSPSLASTPSPSPSSSENMDEDEEPDEESTVSPSPSPSASKSPSTEEEEDETSVEAQALEEGEVLLPDGSIMSKDLADKFAIIAKCESGGDHTINTGNGYYGLLQFSKDTWKDVGGEGLPHKASKEEQLMRGKMLYEKRKGFGAWPSCSKKLD